jgi:UDP-GlcNAc:undecaprenyl-phosphate GlcNAc-1-phosphate transferase
VVGYGVVLLVAAVTTWLLTFVVRHFAVRLGAVVMPGDRHVHATPTPTAGGVAMFGAVVVAMGVASLMGQFDRAFEGSSEPLGVVLAAGVILLVGLVDDVRDVSAPAKLAGQVLAGSLLSFLGVTMLYFRIPFLDIVSISPDMAPLLTVLWVAAIANAVNLIDGLDGLAAGIVAIAAAAFFIYGQRLSDAGLLEPENVGPLIAVVACGVCLGFLPHNFHPAKIFMGDSGSMLIGLMLAAASTTAAGPISQTAYGARDVFALLSPFLLVVAVLFVPALDMLLAIVRRTRAGRSPFSPDKMHLHHRLLQIGHTHRRVVLLIYLWVGIVALGAASTIFFDPRYTGAVMLAAILVAIVVTLIPLLRRRDGQLDEMYDEK